MSELSPAAQAVLDAANGACCYGPDDVLNDSRWIAAAALRAVADQVVPMALCVHNDDFVYVRHQLRALADELEAH